MLERLDGHEFYCFLNGYFGYNQIPLLLRIKRRSCLNVLLVPLHIAALPFGLCNATVIFQMCVVSIFSNMVEHLREIFMDDFSSFGNSFDECLHYLVVVITRCRDKNLTLNWEKLHFIIWNGNVLEHFISTKGINVYKAKVDLITILPHTQIVKAVDLSRPC